MPVTSPPSPCLHLLVGIRIHGAHLFSAVTVLCTSPAMIPLETPLSFIYTTAPAIDSVTFLMWGSGLVLVYWIVTAMYNVWLSPLAPIPGPWWAVASDVWLLSNAARLKKCSALHKLFARYGPVVRVGPRKVVFCTREAVKRVYCAGRFEKSSFYQAFAA